MMKLGRILPLSAQASILKRLENLPQHRKNCRYYRNNCPKYYDTTKGLLNRIRPRLLDDFDLHQAYKIYLLN